MPAAKTTFKVLICAYLRIGGADGVNSRVVEATAGYFERVEIAVYTEFVSFAFFDGHVY